MRLPPPVGPGRLVIWKKVTTFAAVFISRIPKYRQRPDGTIEKYDGCPANVAARARMMVMSCRFILLYLFPAKSSLHVSMMVRPMRLVVCTNRSVSINEVRVYWRTSRRFSPVSFHTAHLALY